MRHPSSLSCRPILGVLAAAVIVSGCAVGANYRRPAIELAPAFRGADTTMPESLATADWRQVFGDDGMRELIAAALAANLDLSASQARVREAQAAVVVARAGGLPTVALGLQTSPAPRQPGETLTSSFLAAGLLSWEIDLWGRVQRTTEAASADLAAVQALREGVQTSLVAQVASRYLELSALHEVQAATEKSAQLQRDSLRLMRRRNQAGIVSSAEVRQAEGQLAATEAIQPETLRQIAATENALSLLMARPPAPLPAVKAALTLPVHLPAGLPSSLLERRPDLRQAEQQLIAANARVGVAKAQLLPSLSITGAFGRLGSELSNLLGSSAASVASLGPNVTQTLYAGGALQANRDVALARLDQALIAYRSTGLAALREVADALESYRRSGEQAVAQQARVTAQGEALRLADKRFAAGIVSFIEVLDAQRQLLAAETDLVNAQLARQLAYVQVYRALGGGWSEGTPASR